MKYSFRWCLRAIIFDSEANFGALCTISSNMACRDFLLQVIFFPPVAILLANMSRVFILLAHPNQDFSRMHSSFASSCRQNRVTVSRFLWIKARALALSYRKKLCKRKDQCMNIFFYFYFFIFCDFANISKMWSQMVFPSEDFRFWCHFRCAAHNVLVYGL